MPVDPKELITFFEWLLPALVEWLAVLACVIVAATVVGWLLTAVLRGPVAATRITFRVLRNTVVDIVRLSPRRTWALARLSIQESIRRRVVVVFIVFIVLLLFSGWYLDPESVDPARLYLNFVLTATSYLVLLLALFLSSQSLPADIKNHTIYTVVTKPVRASEVVLGRIVGFAAMTTFLLLVMGLISFVFVERGLAHTHQLAAKDVEDAKKAAGMSPSFQIPTSRVNGHRHNVTFNPSGKGRVETEQRHWHSLKVHKDGNETTYELGPAEGMLVARVPVYGKLRFLDRDGQPAERGINVGDEWTYRSFISGGTLARAIWMFDGVSPERFPKGLPIEMTLEVFRTYKGDIEKGIPGTLTIRNPKTGAASSELPFVAKKYDVDVHLIPRNLHTREGKPLDLFQDLVDDGKVEVWLKCAAPAQNFGAAQGDMYLRAGDGPFAWNFAKGYFGIWLQTLLVISLGVTFSTFLSGPVAMMATAGGAGGRVLQRLHVSPLHATDLRRRSLRIAPPPGNPGEHDLAVGARLADDGGEGARSSGGSRPVGAVQDPARLRRLQLLRSRRQRVQHLRRPCPDLHLPGVCVPAAGVRGWLLVSEKPRGG